MPFCESLWKNADTPEERLRSEDDCLAVIDALFPSASEHTPQGRGHDCAELAGLPPTLALSTDYFWQDIHFRTRYFTPEETGAKALAVAVSDLAAAGAVPLGFSLGLMLPPGIAKSTLHRMCAGMAGMARLCGIVLTGGDISRGERLGFCVSVWGAPPAPGTAFLRRGPVLPGDCLFLVGPAGLAGTGLWALEKSGRSALARRPSACAAHLAPQPLLREGQTLARLARTHPEQRLALMDVSDGLMRDVPRILAGAGADLSFDPALIHPEIIEAARHMGITPEELFLRGGEDYALLGSCAEPLWPLVQNALPGAALLGRVTARPGCTLRGRDVALEGFDHFSPQNRAQVSGNAANPAQESGVEETANPADAPDIFEKDVLDAAGDISTTCRQAWERGLLAGFNGNVSRKLPGDACVITRAGAAKSRLAPADFALLRLPHGEHLAGAPASSEAGAHLAIYQARPEAGAVVHSHPPHLQALGLLLPPEDRLRLPLPEAGTYRARLGFAPDLAPGSSALAKAVGEAAKNHAAIWIEHHGLMACGPDLQSALALTEELDQLAQVHLAVLQGRGGQTTG